MTWADVADPKVGGPATKQPKNQFTTKNRMQEGIKNVIAEALLRKYLVLLTFSKKKEKGNNVYVSDKKY